MKVRLAPLLVVICSLMIYSCKSNMEESISGNYSYSILRKGIGDPAKDKDYIMLNFKAIDSKDSVWFDRKADRDPFVLKKDSAKWESGNDWIYEIFYNAVKGDSLSFDIDPLEFASNAFQNGLDENLKTIENLTIHAGVYDVMGYDEYVNYMTVTLVEIKKAELKEIELRLEKEKQSIREIIRSNDWVSDSTHEGLQVVIVEEGEGPRANSGQKVTVEYTGSILNGKMFDTSKAEEAKQNDILNPSRTYEPYEFVIDRSSVIRGWHEGFKFLNKGSKAIFFVPYSMGYGEEGYLPVIPPYATLKFEVEVTNIE